MTLLKAVSFTLGGADFTESVEGVGVIDENNPSQQVEDSWYPYLSLAGQYGFIASFAAGWGPVCWVSYP